MHLNILELAKATPSYIYVQIQGKLISLKYEIGYGQVLRWMHKLLPILEKTLDRKLVLPKRKIDNVEAFIKAFPEVKDLFIDGTERRVQRSSDNKKQRLDYRDREIYSP